MADQEAPRAARVSPRERLALVRTSAVVPSDLLDISLPTYDPDEFTRKTILVTGVSHFGGFGYETARQLTAFGAKAVAFNYRERTEEVDRVVADLEERASISGTKIIALQADISRRPQAASLVRKVVRQAGSLDVYIDNASRIAMGLLVEQTPQQTYVDLMTNVVGPQIILGEAVKQMYSQDSGGRVVSVLSLGADGSPGQSRYAGSKAYKFAASRSGAMEAIMQRKDVTFVSVAPGLSPTVMTSVLEAKARPSLLRMIGQEEEVPPDAVAEYIVYAASSLVPDRLNGQVIPVFKPMRSLE